MLYAADHPRRREYWVGGSTAATLAGNALIPGLLDRHLGRTGFDSQQADRPRDADQPANLWEPADGETGHDFGARGIFDDTSIGHSYQLWLSQHHGTVAAASVAAMAAGARLLRRLR